MPYDFDWLAKQNGGTFDPQIFGDYRDPQGNGFDETNIFGGGGGGESLFDGSLFPDLDADFSTQFFAPAAAALPETPNRAAKKPDLIAQIDAMNNSEMSPGNDSAGMKSPAFSTAQIWYVMTADGPKTSAQSLTFARQQLSSCRKVQSGEVDMDALCSELAQKATCTGHGPEVEEKMFHRIVNKYVPSCPADGGKKK